MDHMPNMDREIAEIIERAQPGVNDLIQRYEGVEGQYIRAVSASSTTRHRVVTSANTRS